jgi:hypothetical protein
MTRPVKRFALALAAGGCLALAPAALASPADVLPQQSSNWAGYAISDATTIQTGTTDATQAAPLAFSDVTATWTVPKVTCATQTSPTYSAFWVGVGGFSDGSQALEQAGVDADCSETGKPVYYAWYELVPAPATQVTLVVGAGDTVTASVVVDGTDVLVQVKNRTRGTNFTKHLHMANPDVSSAEVIAEAPSACTAGGRGCRVLPLANFGKVGFTRIAAIANGHPGTLSDQTWSAAQIKLVPRSTRGIFGGADNTTVAGAVPAAVSPDGRSFAVGWVANGNTG